MYKMNARNHTSIKERFYVLCKKFPINVRDIYAQDAVAVVSSMLTDIFPKIGKYATNLFVALIYNILTVNVMRKMDLRIVLKATVPKRILIISDLNIGDAVNLQSVVLPLRRIFHQSKIDYAVNKNVHDIIAFNPHIDRVFSILSYDTKNSAKAVSSLINLERYDLVINLCPFFKKNSIINDKHISYLNFASMSTYIIHNELYSNQLNHISYQAYQYFSQLFYDAKKIINISNSFTPSLWVSNEALEKARVFLIENGLFNNRGLVLFNPDATSKYTQIPFDVQLDILRKLSKTDSVRAILLTSGHSFVDIEHSLIKSLPNRDKIIVIPKYMSLDVYTALIDFCDVFVTADTGTMHIAAAKRFDEDRNALNNKTAIFSIFGATSARLYGYDSFENNFLNSAQNAPAKLYVSKASCKNITCTNKKAKRCKNIRCFNDINGLEISRDIVDYMSGK